MKKKETAPQFNKRKKRAQRLSTELKKLFPKAKIALKYSNNFELLVAVILSAQCTDVMVNKVTERLFNKYRRLKDYLDVNPSEFEKDIYSTGFYRNKTKNILGAARVVNERFDGELPKTMTYMLEIPGVARKTANVVLGNAYGVVEGIAVDTHVRRISRLYGLTDEVDPVKIEQDLMALLPRNEWLGITYRMIDYGRKYCTARKHDHLNCPLTKILRKS